VGSRFDLSVSHHLVSSCGWTPVGQHTISSEDRVAWNFKVPRARENRLLEKHQVVSIGRKKGTKMKTGCLSSIEEYERSLGG